MRLAVLVALSGCAFHAGVGHAPGDDARPIDASIDVAPDAPPPFCPSDPHLVMCFSFDQNPLPASQPDEASAQVTAALTNVTSILSPHGRAAQLAANSEIYLPQGTGVTGVLAAEIWFRYDSEPANNGDRMGLYDSNVVPPNISLFFYRADPDHTLRCGLGGQTEIWTTTALAPATWYHAACLCDGTAMRMFVDGVQVGDTRPGSCGSGGAFVGDGFTIGSNNNGAGNTVDAQLLGAVDGIRLWNVAMTAPPP